MGALDNFLRRFGYAKLDRYGLVMTGDDRVLSTRPTVLDDGLGGKIVGWHESDLAAMELERWGAPKTAPAKPVAAPPSLHRLPPLAAQVIAPAAKLPGVAPAPVAVAPVAAAPIVAPVPAPVAQPTVSPPVVVAPAPVVAAEPELTEDEWEWEIAMARVRAAKAADVKDEPEPEPEEDWELLVAQARAAAEQVQHAAVAAAKPVPKRSMPVAVAPLPSQEVKTVPVAKIELERRTVIPVPQLPVAARPSDVRPYQSPSQPRRMPRGTARIEDTVRTQPAPPANDDTSPYITLPSEVKPVGYAHTKRVAAKQR